MKSLGYRGIVSVVELVVYVPALCCGLLLASRHGWGKSSGWYFVIIFTLLRVAGSISEIIFINVETTSAYTAAAICSSIGVAPLVALCSGLLSRLNDQIKPNIPQMLFKATGILGLVGAILGINGGIQQSNANNPLVKNPEIKAAVLLFVVFFVAVVGVFINLCLRYQEIPTGERRILIAVGISLPLMLVRLIYALLGDFSHNSLFTGYFPNETVNLCMAVIEEMIVTIIVVSIGLTLRKIPKPVVPEERDTSLSELRPEQNASGTKTAVNHSRRKNRGNGPVTWVFYGVKNYLEDRKAAQTQNGRN